MDIVVKNKEIGETIMNRPKHKKNKITKKLFAMVAVMVMLLTMMGESFSHKVEAASKTTTIYSVNASALNVRSGAGTKYKTIGSLKRNAIVTVKKTMSNGWYQINYKSKKGYVSGQYISKTKVLNVPLIKQRPQLPSGCEVTSVAMALAYYGKKVDKTVLAKEMPKDKTALKRNKDGSIKTWGDPEVGFVGDPFGTGFTINPKPLKKVVDKYRKGSLALYGKNFSTIEGYVKDGKPTVVWFTISHEMPYNRYWKTSKGKKITAPSPLHAIVVTGVDKKYVYFNDPESNKQSGQHVRMAKDKFVKIYNAMGKKALVVK